MTRPEFSRVRRVDGLGREPASDRIEADAAERAALAERFGLLSVDSLAAEVTLIRDGEIVTLTGRVRADVVQACVASEAPVPATVDEPLLIRFLPSAMLTASGAEEVELSDPDCDVIGYAGAGIDIGDAVAETMALALDPFPRSPHADAVLRAAGVISEEEAGPFGALAGLKDKLQKG